LSANPRHAVLLERRLIEFKVSAVVDLFELKLAERRQFVKLFLESLIHLPRELWRPTLVILDEAHIYCPERGSGEAESTEAVISLMSQGRTRGVCHYHRHAAAFQTPQACCHALDLYGVPHPERLPGGYYARLRPRPSARAQADCEPSLWIAEICRCSQRPHGAPRIHAELAAQGIHVGRKRVARLRRLRRIAV
jgi:hypothetical protein